MKRTIKVIALCFALAAISTNTLHAGETGKVSPIDFDISVGFECMSGNTTYRIGDPFTVIGGLTYQDYFPFSALKWPLDIWLARVDLGVNIGKSARINGTVKKNTTMPDRNMVDKDWLTYSDPTQLDVYSESFISDLSALILDCDFEWAFLKNKSSRVYAGIGYQYQKFSYVSYLIHQYSPSGQPGWDYYGDGRVNITYDIFYSIPYLILGGKHSISKHIAVDGSIAYSPYVSARDIDMHLLSDNQRITKGDMDGSAYMINVSGTYNISSSLFIEGGVHYTKINVDGTQTQSLYGFPVYLAALDSKSSQTSGYLKIGYNF
ncbi:MAG: omptin family outer membrane protease [Chlorobiaceae bacterium]